MKKQRVTTFFWYMYTARKLNKSRSEMDFDRPNIEDYLPSGSSINEPHGKLRLYCYLSLPHYLDYLSCWILLTGEFRYFSDSGTVTLMFPLYCSISSCDLLDISPTLTEAAGAIVDVSVNTVKMLDFGPKLCAWVTFSETKVSPCKEKKWSYLVSGEVAIICSKCCLWMSTQNLELGFWSFYTRN